MKNTKSFYKINIDDIIAGMENADIFFPNYARYSKRNINLSCDKPQKRIILVSDTHITNGGIFNQEKFEQAVKEILKIKSIDYILHLGDLTHNGTYLDYNKAVKLIKPYPKDRFYIIPGNHDSRNVGYLLFEEFFGSRTFEIEDELLYILGVDSSFPDQDAGRIGKMSILSISEKLKNKKDKIKILCFHHHLLPIPLTGRERSTIIDGGDMLEMILDCDVDIVINGHRHISNIYSCTNRKNEAILFNCGTLCCTKTRYKELFTYTVMDIYANTVSFTTKHLTDNKTVTRGRYLNRKINPVPLPENKKLYLKIVHIGNTHFSVNSYTEEIYQEAVRQINDAKPDVVVHTGDVTNTNKLDEFELASSKLRHIKYPLIIVPGYCDLQNFGWELFPEWIGPLEPVFENDKVRIIGINSIDMALESGVIGRKKMKETADMFAGKEDKKINIVAFYHNLIPHPKTKFDTMLSDAGNVLKNFTALETKINLILNGHDHISFSLQVEDTVLSSCGTLTSSDYLDLKGNSYNVIYCYDDGFVEIEKVYVRSKIKQIIGSFWISI